MKGFYKLSLFIATAALTACGGGGGGGDGGGLTPPSPPVSDACSIAAQKDFVFNEMQFWYLWNDRLPATVDLEGFATAEELLAFLASFSPDLGNGPVDRFSFLTSATSDQQFFGEGRYEGFGFSSRFLSETDWRLTRVFADSPAGTATPPMERGQSIVALDGRRIADIQAAEGTNAVLANDTVDFTLRPVGGNPNGSDDFVITLTQAIVTIDPVPQHRILDGAGGQKIGYLELATFISTASPALADIFSEFQAAGVTALIVDLRYNGGGLVSTAEELADLLDGAGAADLVFSKTEFNADRMAELTEEERELLITRFQRLGNSLDIGELVVIATRGTASASELVANGLVVDANVTIVGDSTFGKPVGQIGLELGDCDILLRPTSFKNLNAFDEGDYFDGLPVTTGCDAPDDLDIPVGDFFGLGDIRNDPNLEKAMQYLVNGSCSADAVTLDAASKPGGVFTAPRPDLSGPPWREYANAW